MSDSRVLDLATVRALAVIDDAARRTMKVSRAVDDGRVINGIARHLVVDENAGFLTATDDIRDAYLRVTGESGMEHFWPVAELVPLVSSGEFAQHDW